MQVVEEFAAHFYIELIADLLASLRNKLGLQLNVFLRVETNIRTIRYFLGQILSFHNRPLFHGPRKVPSYRALPVTVSRCALPLTGPPDTLGTGPTDLLHHNL